MAGGKSLRMGFDKQSIRVDDRYLVQEVALSLCEDFSQIIVVTNEPSYYEGLPVEITRDILPSEGPLSGIHAGLTYAKAEYSFVLACDMPYYLKAYADRMKEEIAPGSTGILTAYPNGRIEPFHAFYHRSLVQPIEEGLRSGIRKIRVITDAQGVQSLPIELAKEYSEDLLMFQNLNTQEELEAFLRTRSRQIE